MAEPLALPAASPAGDSELTAFLAGHERIVALTGAGCSTASGIPDYRGPDGEWKHRRPTTYQRFVTSAAVRQRYWAGSIVGWGRIAAAEPNAAHRALATLEARGRLHWLVTQNVDGLHQRAGNRRVTDLHGRLDKVLCLGCRTRYGRRRFQDTLLAWNGGGEAATGELPRAVTHARSATVTAPAAARTGGAVATSAPARPDGDADIAAHQVAGFRVPPCPSCGGVLKPDVVFFGEGVPPRRVEEAMGRLAEADALLVVGSSLMVWSGYRFVRRAAELGIPVAAVNLGRTRADAELALKVEGCCTTVLPAAAARLGC
jgi:NAD-dependent SIR2 family protein deacetylase